jgi:hypothetical protein
MISASVSIGPLAAPLAFSVVNSLSPGDFPAGFYRIAGAGPGIAGVSFGLYPLPAGAGAPSLTAVKAACARAAQAGA